MPSSTTLLKRLKEHGVKQVVLVAGSSTQPGKPGVGKVWQHFLDLGIEYCVLRPTWFMGVSLTGLCGNMSLG